MNAVLKPSGAADLYQQLIDLPENLTGEIIGGQLYAQPGPSGRHGWAHSALGFRLGPPFSFGSDGPGGWWIIDEPEIHFVRDEVVAVPDIAAWRRERMPHIPDDHRFEIVPDWVCEILSPSTAKKDRVLKLPLYARYGVANCWLIDPLARTLEVLDLHEARWTFTAGFKDDDAVRAVPFDAIEFKLSDLWGE
ncbi:MAG TPA: Uma2 family endonuclease [Methylococcaceae bacterium]|nr:Uma2 family endonuclease [Methylococcaceae bacterium]